jgi:hypothetical protein
VIRRLRSRAPLILSLLLVGVGLAMGAAAQGTVQITNVSQPVTQREFYTVLASGFVFIVAGTAGAVRFMFSLSIADFRQLATRLEGIVARFEDRQFNHNESASAHTVALAPVNEKIEKLKCDLADAVEECLGHRAKRRATDDSGVDFTMGDGK